MTFKRHYGPNSHNGSKSRWSRDLGHAPFGDNLSSMLALAKNYA